MLSSLSQERDSSPKRVEMFQEISGRVLRKCSVRLQKVPEGIIPFVAKRKTSAENNGIPVPTKRYLPLHGTPYNTTTLGDKITPPLGRTSDPVYFITWGGGGTHNEKMVASLEIFRREGCILTHRSSYSVRPPSRCRETQL